MVFIHICASKQDQGFDNSVTDGQDQRVVYAQKKSGKGGYK